MAPKTRLDPIVKLRGHEEEKAQIVLASAGREVLTARQNLADAEVRLLKQGRVGELARDYEVADAARSRAAHDVRQAADQVTRAKFREEQARTAYISAHRKVEVVRRAADRKREDLVTEQNKAENKEIDTLATLMYSYKRPPVGRF